MLQSAPFAMAAAMKATKVMKKMNVKTSVKAVVKKMKVKTPMKAVMKALKRGQKDKRKSNI